MLQSGNRFITNGLSHQQKDTKIKFQVTLHKKTYFPSPGISWKAQKDQVNIIFPSTF